MCKRRKGETLYVATEVPPKFLEAGQNKKILLVDLEPIYIDPMTQKLSTRLPSTTTLHPIYPALKIKYGLHPLKITNIGTPTIGDPMRKTMFMKKK